MPVFLRGIDIEQLVLLQVFRRLQRVGPLEQLRRADRRQHRVEQRAVIVIGGAVARENEANIDIFLVEVPVEVRGREPDLHVRIALLEIVQPRDQPLERHRHIDLHGELVVGGGWLQRPGLRLDHVEGLAHRGKIGVSGLGEFGAPRVTSEQLHAEPLFQRFHLVADSGAGDSQLSRCQPETSQPGRRLEGGQCT